MRSPHIMQEAQSSWKHLTLTLISSHRLPLSPDTQSQRVPRITPATGRGVVPREVECSGGKR